MVSLLISNSLKVLLIPSPALHIHPLTIKANILCGAFLSTLHHHFLNLFLPVLPFGTALAKVTTDDALCSYLSNQQVLISCHFTWLLRHSITTKHCPLVFFTFL